MTANPEPTDATFDIYSKRSIMKTNAGRPELSDLLEM
jgi:hypothetical protein